MSRNTRTQSCYLWHLHNRGTEKRIIFVDDLDRLKFLAILEQVVIRFGWVVVAYVLMGNHFHLMAETPPDTVSAGLQLLDGWYAHYFNRRWKRPGALFQGRAHGIIVDSTRYLLRLAQYIAMNPVRAGLVSKPEEWRWSSYRATIGLEPIPSWLSCDRVLSQLHHDVGTARVEFARLTVAGVVPPWDELENGFCLGSPEFAKEVREAVRREFERHKQVPERLVTPPASLVATVFARVTGVENLADATPGVQAVFAHLASLGRVPLREVGEHLQISKATAARRAQRGAELVREDAWRGARDAFVGLVPPEYEIVTDRNGGS